MMIYKEGIHTPPHLYIIKPDFSRIPGFFQKIFDLVCAKRGGGLPVTLLILTAYFKDARVCILRINFVRDCVYCGFNISRINGA